MGADYALHAKYWDWDGYDDSAVYQFWLDMAKPYGTRVFSPMCAIGQTAAYMVRHGMTVTALDLEPEMIREGQKRFGQMEKLKFVCGNVCNCELNECYDFAFFASTDLHLLPDMEDVQRALRSINRHLRMGGGLGLEVWFAPDTSFTSPVQRFEPRAPRKDGLYIWKEGDGQYDAAVKVHRIHQVVHVGDTLQFDHDVALQLYDRKVLMDVLNECGFTLKQAYCDTDKNISRHECENTYLELIKRERVL